MYIQGMVCCEERFMNVNSSENKQIPGTLEEVIVNAKHLENKVGKCPQILSPDRPG